MNFVWAALIIVTVAAVAISGMLLVRRRAPEGSYFEDGDRAAGVFGVLATGFAVLLGFVVFLAFESYDTVAQRRRVRGADRPGAVRDGAAHARAVRARLLGRARLLRALGRAPGVAADGVGHARPTSTTRGASPCSGPCGRSSRGRRRSRRPTAKWLDQRTDREDARADRTHGAEGVIPTPLWIVLFLSAVIIFVFMLFFADSAERAIVQATMMGSVAVVITSTLLLLWFLDNPYHPGVGGLKPFAMQRTVERLTHDTGIAAERFRIPCDAHGNAL